MSDIEPILRGEIDSFSPSFDNNDSPTHLITPIDECGQAVAPGSPSAPDDRAWAVAFKINVIITVISAVFFHRTALTAMGDILTLITWPSNLSHGDLALILLAWALVVPLAYAISWTLLRAMTSFMETVLMVAITVFVMGFLLTVTLMMLSKYTWPFAVALAAVGALVAKVFFYRRGRINFANANLKLAALAVTSTPKILGWALCTMAVRIVWLAVAGIAFVGSVMYFQTVHAPDGVIYRAMDCNIAETWMPALPPSCVCNGNIISNNSGCEFSRPNALLVCFWIVSVTWSVALTVNVAIATVAASVTSWWSSPNDVESAWVSFSKVIRFSLGPMSKAAGIGGLYRSLHIGYTLIMHGIWLISCCPLCCMRYAADYMMENTVSFISMYRLSFSEALRRAWALYRKQGISLLMNELVGGMGLSFVAVAGFGVALLALVASFKVFPTSVSLASLVLRMTIYFAIVSPTIATLEVMVCAYKAVSIAFLQEPNTFSASHDGRLYDGLLKAWREMGLSHPSMTGGQGEIQV